MEKTPRVDENTIKFVAIHELAHLMTKEIDTSNLKKHALFIKQAIKILNYINIKIIQ